MADRTSAEIFGTIFKEIAGHQWQAEGTGEYILGRDAFAAWLYELSKTYDFTVGQMEAEDALVALGVAISKHDPWCPSYMNRHSVWNGEERECTCKSKR